MAFTLRAAWLLWWIGALGASHTGQARADARVLVLHGDGAPERSGLRGALRVQLAGVGTPEVVAGLPAGSLAARVRHAESAARHRGATLATWVEPDPGAPDGRQYVLYLVGPGQEQALLHVMRLPDGAEADVDRSLALKVREVFDQLRSRPVAAAFGPAPAAERPPSSLAAQLSVGALWAPGIADGSRGLLGLELAAGAKLHDGAWGLSLDLRASLPASLSERRMGQSLELTRRTAWVAAAAYWRLDGWELGLRASAGVDSERAQGATDTGLASHLSRQVAAFRLGPLVKLDLLGQMGLELWAGVDARSRDRVYTVDGVELTRMGSLRPFGVLSLVFATP